MKLLLVLTLTGCSLAGVPAIERDAARARPLVESEGARRFVAALPKLPRVKTRVIDRADHPPLHADEDFFYEGKYGTPVAYARAVDILAGAGFSPTAGQRLLDFGYGAIGPLYGFALLGLDAVGVDVDPLLPLLYAGRSGSFGGGKITLVDGRWPADANTAAQVGGGYDVILSKNTLKRGYIHPHRPVDEKKLIHLGVDDATFLQAVHDALKPGGLFLIYNICPALTPPDKPFVPWSDGRSPFAREQFAAAGLDVVAFDVDDVEKMARLARAFEWDRGADQMDLAHDFSVLYTLARRQRDTLPSVSPRN